MTETFCQEDIRRLSLLDTPDRIAALERLVVDYDEGRRYSSYPGKFPPTPIQMVSDYVNAVADGVGISEVRWYASWSIDLVIWLLREVERCAREGSADELRAALADLDRYRDGDARGDLQLQLRHMKASGK